MRMWREQTGDTIVEVLITIAITAGVLGGAYALVNRTLSNTRQAQEHAEALQIAREQVELIAVLARGENEQLTNTSRRFHCIDSEGKLHDLSTSVTTLPAPESDYPAACRLAGDVNYRVAFVYSPPQKSFNVFVNWPSITGDGEDQVNLVYKALDYDT